MICMVCLRLENGKTKKDDKKMRGRKIKKILTKHKEWNRTGMKTTKFLILVFQL